MSDPRPLPRFAALVGALFFFSGFAALVYQVVWMRHLSLFFGSDVYAAAITLSVFMGGLSVGSFLAEKWVDRLTRPLLWYGVIEIGIGIYAFFFSPLLHAFSPWLTQIYRTEFDAVPLLYQAARIVFSASLLIPPTVLMGITLPLIVRSFARREGELGRFGGFFYSLNTLGALAGTIVSAFLLIPYLGVHRTTLTAVAVNLLIGCAVAAVALRRGVVLPTPPASPEGPSEASPSWKYDPSAARVALFGIGLSGLAALALEVIWTRILTLSFSGTVYSFATMLASFLFGIFYGSRQASAVVDACRNPVRTFAFLEFALGTSVALLAVASALVPVVFGLLIRGLAGLVSFGAGSMIAQFLVAALLIFIPTALLGATFPYAVRICTPDADHAGSGTGRVYGANTLGAIFGSLLAGFVLIPAVGSRNSLVVIAFLFTANGLLLFWQSGHRGSFSRAISGSILPLTTTAVAALIAWFLPRQIILNYGQARNLHPEVLYHGEGIAHSVDIVRNPQHDVIMSVDGNIEADTSFIQRRHFVLKGHLPLLLHPAPREVAVVGLGLGLTLASTERNPEVESIQVIELNREMAAAQEALRAVNGGVLFKPKVHLRIDDGRNFLAMTERQFDMITADPIHPRITGVGYLYTEEYYRILKARLKPGGVVCQWMPMYNISRRSFDAAFRTFARVFENGSFWYVRGHGLFIATEQPFTIDYARFAARAADPLVVQDLASIEIPDADHLLAHCLMGPRQIQAYLASCPDAAINTDDNAYLEYFTPFEFMHPTREIVAALAPHAGLDPDLFVNIDATARERLQRAWEARHARLLPELDEPLR
jgi:spermidine synthase